MIVCNGADSGLAQALATKLGVPVKAYNGTATVKYGIIHNTTRQWLPHEQAELFLSFHGGNLPPQYRFIVDHITSEDGAQMFWPR